MRAVVVEGPNRVSYREVQAPTAGPHDVLVQSREAVRAGTLPLDAYERFGTF